MTVKVDPVAAGSAHNLNARSKITIEDLKTKHGTEVDGRLIKNDKVVVEGSCAEIMLGKFTTKFRIMWEPVVFTFSFSKKELQSGPIETLQDRFEQLDIKLLTEYHHKWTTHVVSKKRNTVKALQALVDARYIVTETFLDAVVKAAYSPDDTQTCVLEQNFDKWPDAKEHVPSPGGEPKQHTADIYYPDTGRADVFEGYTFIFYDRSQYENLMPAVNAGGGKTLLEEVVAGKTEPESFARRVEEVAGEKGLGSFEDGSEGKGVVLVRYIPSKGDQVQWYANFFTSVSLLLDHRPIDQNEFLEAILIKDASILRRPLEIESSTATQDRAPGSRSAQVSRSERSSQSEYREQASQSVEPATAQPAPRRGRRGPVKRRFVGFDNDSDDATMADAPAAAAPPPPPVEDSIPVSDEEGLFVSQQFSQQDQPASTKAQKRHAPQDDLMEGMAPAAARFKRQRLAERDDFAVPDPEPESETPAAQEPKTKIKKEVDISAQLYQHRQMEEERARREKEDLANLPDDVDLAEIRRLNIVEEMDIRRPGMARTREQDVADGRWNPKWNGMKNFKKFRKRGEVTGARQPVKQLIQLQEVKNKEFGVGDDFWLEDEGTQKRHRSSQRSVETREEAPPPPPPPQLRGRAARVIGSESEDEDEELPAVSEISAQPSRTRVGSQASTRQTTLNKRPAPTSESATEQAPKRARPTRRAAAADESDDSDDELKFRFGRRRK
ncbi:uncharacterized protein J7T54_008393 [Emericellopsis cladophorae]|uniref:Nibrin second BRCT domain-containing protein n=1 Tax=Emericellopsis cladophorae TaxID=2686198 RepID=A0A9P9Y2I6_9HYPO|nr:uncharacterized protein J7T54_008393 [Emericellopsis cladophorae]KAI6782307.1 hypothetical protein J7T54_008393 [Emericellopsis cladophorae]